jgi:hypothetical protein
LQRRDEESHECDVIAKVIRELQNSYSFPLLLAELEVEMIRREDRLESREAALLAPDEHSTQQLLP